MSEHNLNVSANERQVGGDHYKGGGSFQHWDYVALNSMDYFTGQITRYVLRWNKKNGVQDIEKAIHYLDKLKELENAGIVRAPFPRAAIQLGEFIIANKLTQTQHQIFYICSTWTSATGLNAIGVWLEELLKEAKEKVKTDSSVSTYQEHEGLGGAY